MNVETRAACGAYPGEVLAAYAKEDTPLPTDSIVHWLHLSMRMVMDATPSLAELLPPSASRFFHHFANKSLTASSSLHSTISSQVSKHAFNASVSAAQKSKKDKIGQGELVIAHVLTYSAPHSSMWKSITPATCLTTLTDKLVYLTKDKLS
jgi:hypothetical protein